ncbi:MAG: hypothetical protein Kow00121_53030 [Elainellaceae cyanobacterium]
MNIKTLLLHLQDALKQEGLSQQMLLYPGSTSISLADSPTQAVNFVVGYSGSPNSQTALDFVFWMAHQTRVLTQQQVTVHVVYALDSCEMRQIPCVPCTAASSLKGWQAQLESSTLEQVTKPSLRSPNSLLKEPFPSAKAGKGRQLAQISQGSSVALSNSLEKADRILWQARCLADEWRGSLEAHLRFGDVATELSQVISEKAANLLFVGCSFSDHPLIQQLIANGVPCPILGIPTELEAV